LWHLVQPLVRLYGAIAAADGGAVTFEPPAEVLPLPATSAEVVRAATAIALEALVHDRARVEGTATRRGEEIVVSVRGTEPPAPVDDGTRAALAAGGAELRRGEEGILIFFAPGTGGGTGVM
jgi:hypothetical protein